MNNKTMFQEFIGKEVWLYPNDSYYKFAILVEVNEYGYIFKMADCHKDSGYAVGEHVFFNHAMKVTFKLRL